MKKIMGGLSLIFLAAGEMVLLAGNVNAQVSMPEREHVQTMVWLGEFISFITAAAIAVFVWRVSKRDSKNKKSKHDDSKHDDLDL